MEGLLEGSKSERCFRSERGLWYLSVYFPQFWGKVVTKLGLMTAIHTVCQIRLENCIFSLQAKT